MLGLSFLQGFQVLVESDWLDFGHKFGDRCGHQENAEDQNEQCPVFLQWLDSVHQLLKQFPCLFEFNEAFLVSPPLLVKPVTGGRGWGGGEVAKAPRCELVRPSRSNWCSTRIPASTARSWPTTPASERSATSTSGPALCGLSCGPATRTFTTSSTHLVPTW